MLHDTTSDPSCSFGTQKSVADGKLTDGEDLCEDLEDDVDSIDKRSLAQSPSTWHRIRVALLSPAMWSMVDQIIVSGLRFASTMIVGRFCGPVGLGTYVLAFSIVLAASLSHESLVAKPFQIFSQHVQGAKLRRYNGSTLVQMLCLAILCSLIAAIFGGVFANWKLHETIPEVAFSMVLVLPGVLLWEFMRRQAFSRLRMKAAAIMDGMLAVLQISSLLALGLFGQLTVSRSLLIMGACCVAVSVPVLIWQRRSYRIVKRLLCADAMKNLSFGKWFFAGQLVGLIQAYAVPWMLTFFYSAEATGILMACQTLVLLSNPILLGLANWLNPVAAREFARGGASLLIHLLNRVTVIALVLITPFVMGLWLLGDWLLRLAFGSDFEGYGHLVAITGFTSIGFLLTIIGSSGLGALMRPRMILWGTIAGSLVSILSLPLLTAQFSLTGAAWSLAAGSLIGGSIHIGGCSVLSKNALNTNPKEKFPKVQNP